MDISDHMSRHLGELGYILLDELSLGLGGGLIECCPVDARSPGVVLVNEHTHGVLLDPDDCAFDFRLSTVTNEKGTEPLLCTTSDLKSYSF